MAYIIDDENEENQSQEGETPASQGQIIAGASSAPIQGGAAAKAPGTPTSSGSFTNLRSYIGANQGNDAAMGQAVSGTVKNSADTATTKGSAFQDDATKRIAASTIKDTTGLANTVRTGFAQPKATKPESSPYQQTASDPGVSKSRAPTAVGSGSQGNTRQTEVAATPAPAPIPEIDSAEFNRLYNAEYKGPKAASDVSGFGETNAAFDKVKNYGQMANPDGDTMGRGQLLSDTYGTGGRQYRGGERTLDSFILGAGQQGADALKDINQTYGGYDANFKNIADLIGVQAAEGQATTEQARSGLRAASDEARASLEGRLSDAQTRARDLTAANESEFQALRQGDPDTWQKYGVSPSALAYAKANGINPATLLEGGPTAFSLGDVADTSDVQGYSKLNELLRGAGANPTQQFTNFAASGGSKASISGAKTGAAEQLSKLDPQIRGELAAAQNIRNADFQSMSEALSPFATPDMVSSAAQRFGVPEELLHEARRVGLDPRQWLSAGRNLGLHDVLKSAPQYNQFSQLSDLLGISRDLGPMGDVGSGANFDMAGFKGALQAALTQNPTPPPKPGHQTNAVATHQTGDKPFVTYQDAENLQNKAQNWSAQHNPVSTAGAEQRLVKSGKKLIGKK